MDYRETEDLHSPDDIALADRMKTGRQAIITELQKRIVGQAEIIELVLQTLFVGAALYGIAFLIVARSPATVKESTLHLS